MLGAILFLVVADEAAAPHGVNAEGDRDALTPLHVAAGKGEVGTIRALIEAGASLEATLTLPLTLPLTLTLTLTLTMIGAGASLEATSDTGITPLHMAAASGHASAIEALTAAGASPSARDITYGKTPLHEATGRGHTKAIRALVAAGASLEAGVQPLHGGHRGLTPLHVAAALGRITSLEVLLALGASHGSQDANGDTPLHVAAYNGHVRAIKVLAAAGASVGAFNHAGETPLESASLEGHVEAGRALMAAVRAKKWADGADIAVFTSMIAAVITAAYLSLRCASTCITRMTNAGKKQKNHKKQKNR